MSISEANLAAYYSVEHMVYYNICGWVAPFAWVIFFFMLSKFGVSRHMLTNEHGGTLNMEHFELNPKVSNPPPTDHRAGGGVH